MMYIRDRGKDSCAVFINNDMKEEAIPKDNIKKLIIWIFRMDPPNIYRRAKLNEPVRSMEIK